MSHTDDSPQSHSFNALVIQAGRAHMLLCDGELADQAVADLHSLENDAPWLVCHLASQTARLPLKRMPLFLDVLELFAFVRPAQFTVPTADGLAKALGFDSKNADDAVMALNDAVPLLLSELSKLQGEEREQAARTAQVMQRAGWGWGPYVVEALGPPQRRAGVSAGLDIWNQVPEWQDRAPPPPPTDLPVMPDDALSRLFGLLGHGAEERAEQREFAVTGTRAFVPRQTEDNPNLVIAEAGTGVGKTLGYVAPASLWAEQNGAPVWLSTYTKNLQRQLDDEIARLYPNPEERAEKTVIRKGRENYLCLLNYQELVGQAQAPQSRIILGLVARWATASRDGALRDGDFPTFLTHLIDGGVIASLSDRRGECIHSACPHHRRCFIEIAAHKSQHAQLVIANHALVLIQSALGRFDIDATTQGSVRNPPTRFVMDEGHHLFDAADSTFAAHLTALELAELRRWLRGKEGASGRRGRGLAERITPFFEPEPLTDDADDEDKKRHEALSKTLGEAHEAMREALEQTGHLPAQGALRRIMNGEPYGDAETFLMALRDHVAARAADRSNERFGQESPLNDPAPELLIAARDLHKRLSQIEEPLKKVAAALDLRLREEADRLDSGTRNGIEAAVRGITQRVLIDVAAFRSMLEALAEGTPEGFVDWGEISREAGRVRDVGIHRHYIDPTRPLAEALYKPAHGVLVTSATLRDKALEDETGNWESAELRLGAQHLVNPAIRTSLTSPFDYGANTRIFIVNDLGRSNADHVAAAYRALIEAAGGGTLGLFTAIERLRAVHKRIKDDLEARGLELYAQHVDEMEKSTLVDIFRAREDASLLGTDAMRDGVDVPGRSLRLLVFDRVPWPRPDLLHRARRAAMGGRPYEEMLVRLRLKQAFGRLVRRADDRGCFVMLDGRTPTRLLTAFPDTVPVERLGLADTVSAVRAFLAEDTEQSNMDEIPF